MYGNAERLLTISYLRRNDTEGKAIERSTYAPGHNRDNDGLEFCPYVESFCIPHRTGAVLVFPYESPQPQRFWLGELGLASDNTIEVMIDSTYLCGVAATHGPQS